MFNPDTDWRRVTAAIYKKPTDSKIFGSVELDVTHLEEFLNKNRVNGTKLTFTHFFAFAIAMGIHTKVPQLNTFVRRGRIVSRPSIDVGVSVLNHDQTEMNAVVVRDAIGYNLHSFTRQLNELIAQSKSGAGVNTKGKYLLAKVPWPFRNWFFRLVRFVTVGLGLFSSTPAGITNRFGSFILSNIGSVGLDVGYAALLPASNVSAVFTLGTVETLPRYINGQLTPRRIIKLAVTLDHRLVDGLHGGLLFRYLKQVVRNPDLLEK